MPWTIRKIKKANKDGGGYFFSPSTMRFFNSKVEDKVYEGIGGIYFVTSERGPLGDGRRYTPRKFNPEIGDCGTAGCVPFSKCSHDTAHAVARLLSRGEESTAIALIEEKGDD